MPTDRIWNYSVSMGSVFQGLDCLKLCEFHFPNLVAISALKSNIVYYLSLEINHIYYQQNLVKITRRFKR